MSEDLKERMHELEDEILQGMRHIEDLVREHNRHVLREIGDAEPEGPPEEGGELLSDAIKRFREEAADKEGAECPCCKKHYHANQRWFNASNARHTIHLVRYTLETIEHNEKSFGKREVERRIQEDGYPWFPYSDLPDAIRSGRLWELAIFGMIETSGRRNKQMWRVTRTALSFVDGTLEIPTSITHIGDVVLRTDAFRSVQRALAGKQRSYDYEDVMTEPLFQVEDTKD